MDKPDEQDNEERDIARILKAAGAREELPNHLKAQWEAIFRDNLKAAQSKRRRSRNRVVMGLCASVTLIAIMLSLTVLQSPLYRNVIRVTQASGDHDMQMAQNYGQAVSVGQLLPPEATLRTGVDGHVAVSYNGHDLRLNTDTRLTFGAEHIFLESGEIYVSNETSGSTAPQLFIDTPNGSIREIGTQFTVAAFPDSTVTTVRRGTVLVNTGAVEVRAQAEADSAIRIVVGKDEEIQQTRVQPNGDEWRWIYLSAPQYTLEGKNVHDFLTWAVAESGMTLEFTNDTARIYALSTVLHGDFGQLSPEQAVGPVLATTDLEALLGEDRVMRISLKDRF